MVSLHLDQLAVLYAYFILHSYIKHSRHFWPSKVTEHSYNCHFHNMRVTIGLIFKVELLIPRTRKNSCQSKTLAHTDCIQTSQKFFSDPKQGIHTMLTSTKARPLVSFLKNGHVITGDQCSLTQSCKPFSPSPSASSPL